MANKRQMEIPGSTNDLEIALDDLCDRLEDMDKLKESIDPAKQRLTDVMFSIRKEKIYHRGRHFTMSSPEIKPKLRITKQKSV
jgi:hypothetical protein